MEFFFEFFCTIAVSIFLSFLISKLLSLDFSSNGDHVTESRSDSTLFEYESSTSCDTENQKKKKKMKRVRAGEGVQVQDVDHDRDVDFDDELFRDHVTVRLSQKSGNDEVVGGVVEEVVVGGGDETVIDDKLFDDSHDQMIFCEIPVEMAKHETILAKDEVILAKTEEFRVLESGDDNERDDDVYDIVMDDWEGIERTELEKQFGAAVRYMIKSELLLNLGSDIQMQLYGLHKVATEGTCHESQPMAFKLSARAKWHAWQQLGNLSQEEAMEQYINLITRNIPGWLGEELTGDSPHGYSDVGTTSKPIFEHLQTVFKNERENNETQLNADCS